MAVSIDTVYQRVLAFANKEQRGYITPQEFNLFANQAQQEIFEQYFYDTSQFKRVHGNDSVHSDISDILETKIQLFESMDDETNIAANWTVSGNGVNIPGYVYRVSAVELNNKDFNSVILSPLTKPNPSRPIANIRGGIVHVISDLLITNGIIQTTSFETPTNVFYIRKPVDVRWGYIVVNNKALYDAAVGSTVDFELHASEESELIYKILKFAGVTLDKQVVMQVGQGMEAAQVQQEKQ